MTLINDEVLTVLFARAGDAFEVPASGPGDILGMALGSTDNPEPIGDPSTGGTESGRVTRLIRSHRALAVAASLVVLLLLGGGLAELGKSSPKQTVTAGAPLGKSTPAGLGAHTTIPTQQGVKGSFGVAAPTPAAAGTAGGAATGGAVGSGPAATLPPMPATSTLPRGTVGQSAKIEQTGSLSLKVARGALSRTMTQVTELAGTYNGFVANSETETGANTADGAPYGSVTLQVPVASFADVLKQAQSLGKTTSLTTRATDVTGQYVDLQSQITSLQASRQQYLTIMSKATTVGDVLAVQSQLDSIQSEIQQLQGQLQVLTSETAFSSLTVTVSEGAVPIHHPAPALQSGLSKAWHDSVHGFAVGVEGLIRLAGPFLFALLCLGALIIGGRLLWRRYQRHNL